MGGRLDALVVGGRCAGAATAMLLARAGARVLIVDRGAYGTDTLSTHALMRGAVLQLRRWGVLPVIVAAGTPPVRSTAFSYPGQELVVPVEPRFGVEALYAPRRALLDRVLVDAAVASGAEVRYGATVKQLARDSRGRVQGAVVAIGGVTHRIEAPLVIGADGLRSTVAREVAAESVVRGAHAAGVLYSYWEGLSTAGYEWGFGSGTTFGAIPTDGGATCVFVSVESARFADEARGDATRAYDRLLVTGFPDFARRLRGARRVEPVRGFAGHAGYIRRSCGPGWALVGDAAYFKDPLTAHGITDALRDAELLARAVARGTDAAMTECDEFRRELSRRLFEITDEIASLAWDEPRIQWLHRQYSAEMSREVRVLASLEPLPCLLPSPVSAPHGA